MLERRTNRGEGAFSRRRLRLLGGALTVGLLMGILPIAASPALATRGATASVDRQISYRGQTYTYTFTVNNSSTAGEGIGSVTITRPSTTWTTSACPSPPTGWTTIVSATSCVFNSGAGTGDDIAAGATKTFRVTASIAAGKTTQTGVNWLVFADGTDTFAAGDGYATASASSAGSLSAAIYGVELTDVIVATATSALGGACPASNKKAPASSTRVLVICGRVYTNTSFTAKNQNSSVTGTFVLSDGNVTAAAIPAGAGPVVLANFGAASVTTVTGTGLTAIAEVGNANDSTSSSTVQFNGYTTDATAPTAPSVPDLVAGSDSGASATDNVTNDNTPTFSGTAEAGSTVEILVGGVVKATTTATGGAYSATVPAAAALGDGTRSVTARATDASGNVSPVSGALSMVIDTVTPSAPPIDARPGNVGSSTSPSWSFSGEANANFLCSITYPNASVSSDNSCSSPKTFNLASGNDGTYTFRVSQVDLAGNGSPDSQDSYLLDRTAPVAPSITSQPANISSNPAAQWAFSGEAGGTFECVLVRPDLSEVSDLTCSSPKSYNLGAQDGTYTFKVRQVDAAAQAGPYAIDSFELDRQVPAAPLITDAPDPRSNDSSPEWNFAGEAGATFECVLTKPGNVQVTTPDCTAPAGYDVASGVDGTYAFKVRQTDGVGNQSAYATSSYILDRQAPSMPAITSGPANFEDADTPSWTFTGETGTSFECVLVLPDLTEINVTPCSSPQSFDLTSEPDGAYTFKVRQIDAAGNTGTYETDGFTLDRVPPGAPSIDTRPAEAVADPLVQWTFAGEAGATFQCVIVKPDLTEVGDTSCVTPKNFDLGAGTDGLYTFKVRQLDAAGHSGPYATDSFILDRQAPPAPSITGEPSASSSDPLPAWNFTGDGDTTFECVLIKPGNVEVTTPNCSAPRSYNLNSDGDGTYTFKVRQSDAVGNRSPFAASTFVLDRSEPAAPSFTSTPRDYDDDEAPVWRFSGEAGGTFECVLVRPDLSETSEIPCSSPKSVDLSSEPDGNYVFKLRQVDAAGNVGEYSTDAFTFDRTPPRPTLAGGAPNITKDPTHEWTFTGVPSATFECRVIHPSGPDTVVPDCTSPYALDLGAGEDGSYTFSVRQFLDENGSVPATDTFTLDRTVESPSLTVQPGAVGNVATPTWSFDGEIASTFECVLIDPSSVESVETACSDPKQYALDAGDGTYTVKVRQTDLAGNISTWATEDYELDRQAPTAPALTSTPASFTRDLTPEWSFTGEGGATFICTLTSPSGAVVEDTDCSDPKGYTLDTVQGNYTFSVTQVDPAGNESAATSQTMRLDLKKPVVTKLRVTPKKFKATTRTMVAISFGRSEPSSATVKIKKGTRTLKTLKKPLGKSKVAFRWKTLFRKKVIAPGKYTVFVALKDRVGLRGKANASFTVTR